MTNNITTPPTRTASTTDNLLSPNKFAITIGRYPNLEIFVQRAAIPTITLGSTILPTNTDVDLKLPGDKAEYEDLILSVIIDENLTGYKEIVQWLQEAASSEKADIDDMFSDLTVTTLTNNSNKNASFVFHNCFPQTIGNILLDTTVGEDQPLTVDVIIKFSHYTLQTS